MAPRVVVDGQRGGFSQPRRLPPRHHSRARTTALLLLLCLAAAQQRSSAATRLRHNFSRGGGPLVRGKSHWRRTGDENTGSTLGVNRAHYARRLTDESTNSSDGWQSGTASLTDLPPPPPPPPPSSGSPAPASSASPPYNESEASTAPDQYTQSSPPSQYQQPAPSSEYNQGLPPSPDQYNQSSPPGPYQQSAPSSEYEGAPPVSEQFKQSAPSAEPGSNTPSTEPVSQVGNQFDVNVTALPPAEEEIQHSASCAIESQPINSQVTDASNYPFQSIGELYNPQGGRCTGALVGRCHVITAAHCVFSFRANNFKSDWVFVPAVSGSVAPFGAYKSKNVEAPPEATGGNDASYDIAMVVLSTPVDLPPFQFGSESADLPQGCRINQAGYPYQGQMWFQVCQVTGKISGDKFVSTSCYGRAGESGGPIWTYNAERGERKLRAIMTAQSRSRHDTGAVIVNAETAGILNSWIGRNPC